MVDIQCPTAEIRRGNKKKVERRRNHRMKIYNVRILLCTEAIKNGDAQKKRAGRQVRAVSPEAGRESMVGKICERGRS